MSLRTCLQMFGAEDLVDSYEAERLENGKLLVRFMVSAEVDDKIEDRGGGYDKALELLKPLIRLAKHRYLNDDVRRLERENFELQEKLQQYEESHLAMQALRNIFGKT